MLNVTWNYFCRRKHYRFINLVLYLKEEIVDEELSYCKLVYIYSFFQDLSGIVSISGEIWLLSSASAQLYCKPFWSFVHQSVKRLRYWLDDRDSIPGSSNYRTFLIRNRVQTCSWGPPRLQYSPVDKGGGGFPLGVKLMTTHFHLGPRLRMRGPIPPLL
jgi:hypothetical protein